MTVQLLAIKFNYNSNSLTDNAMNIRKNATDFVNVPEWEKGISVNPQDSPAVYTIKETKGNILKIQAKFSGTFHEDTAYEIRAIDAYVNPPRSSGCIGFVLWLIRVIIRALFGNVLGEVKAKVVNFPATGGLTGFETFELKNVRIWSVGIGIHTTNWQWQYRPATGGGWVDFENTQHKIYTVLETPTSPWQQLPYGSGNIQLPWTEVLDYACQWSFSSIDVDTAATRITENIFNLGSSIIEYDCPHGGRHFYAFPLWSPTKFDCTAFLDRLNGGVGNGQWVNCTDNATFVSIFSNILGCDLWSSRMGRSLTGVGNSFLLNPLLAIGSNVWQTACNWGSFSYHEVAWKDGCTSNENVFDSCLKVDGDADPTVAPHSPILVANMPFGISGGSGYRDKLSPVATNSTCEPRPADRIRRTIV